MKWFLLAFALFSSWVSFSQTQKASADTIPAVLHLKESDKVYNSIKGFVVRVHFHLDSRLMVYWTGPRYADYYFDHELKPVDKNKVLGSNAISLLAISGLALHQLELLPNNQNYKP